ncbi:hypothetical protein [Leifsonia sp. TF02-11]|uniref:hypothetical protein n=1 Tax=Leifsonia sp. TF02-11 TaxID=2815212 RepID=UPI001AA1260C|nr:hypothetical protein [Leifsonia sp. TF02-11]MBO1741459.1 hypothetical protein [Leifsonia sp. TF02-11]
MKPVVRLLGDDADVRAVGREAVQALKGADSAPALFGAVAELHGRRRQQVVARAASARSAQVLAAPGRAAAPARAWRVIWAALVTTGLLAALLLVIEFGPTDRKNAFSDPQLSATIALVAGAVAGMVLLIVALVPIPDARSGVVGGLSAALIALIAAGILIYRLIVGTGDRRGFSAEDLRWWIPLVAAILVLLVVVAVRGGLARRRGPAVPDARPAPSGGRDDGLRELRRTAERLAATASPAAVQQDWRTRLDRLAASGASAETIAQAETLTPAAWLAWMGYDGEIEIRSVLPRS